jgi:hypothetical protein
VDNTGVQNPQGGFEEELVHRAVCGGCHVFSGYRGVVCSTANATS